MPGSTIVSHQLLRQPRYNALGFSATATVRAQRNTLMLIRYVQIPTSSRDKYLQRDPKTDALPFLWVKKRRFKNTFATNSVPSSFRCKAEGTVMASEIRAASYFRFKSLECRFPRSHSSADLITPNSPAAY
jgi:hypothetical protein